MIFDNCTNPSAELIVVMSCALREKIKGKFKGKIGRSFRGDLVFDEERRNFGRQTDLGLAP